PQSWGWRPSLRPGPAGRAWRVERPQPQRPGKLSTGLSPAGGQITPAWFSAVPDRSPPLTCSTGPVVQPATPELGGTNPAATAFTVIPSPARRRARSHTCPCMAALATPYDPL